MMMSHMSEELVLIPGGEFPMGSGADRDHSPVHTVHLTSFLIDKYEITNAQYLTFCQATAHRLPAFWGLDAFRSGPDFPDHPVVGVSWHDATEYAARGGLVGHHYPNGDTLEPSDGNFSQSGQGGPVAVGSYPPNGYGLFDMQGNVVEWVWDYYDAAYYRVSPTENPKGPESTNLRPEPVKFRVIRGGGWHSGPYCNRVYYRNALPANWVDFNVGFRCAKDVEATERHPS
jgi:formylglycine-generating enzyme required for sulfatase activity